MHVTWPDIALRLVLSVVAGALIGLNRDIHGKPAGMRTTILVAMAATLAMLQADMLLDTAGKTSSSFSVLDLMRLPLGILSGIGFIGAGVILRHNGGVTGVTTAASLWFVTVDGLCIGGGQIGLAMAALVVALAVLSLLKPLEQGLPRWHVATIEVMLQADAPPIEELQRHWAANGIQALSQAIEYDEAGRPTSAWFRARLRANGASIDVPPMAGDVAALPGIASVRWTLWRRLILWIIRASN